ncbi:SusC/RagA family TonB-linked outer membrane protein [Alkaliflexus imshenetskii]|uniref:SusC/RagA family TonB-linked outer membrane protein n=1 Tax=Alkaliflexus imshenetskii TaxID=286730 RepID=UPI000479CD46|nr:TonB-dependent receptor [Alkaliflexus imshenetskii]
MEKRQVFFEPGLLKRLKIRYFKLLARFAAITGFILLSISTAYAQERQITGVVTDAFNEPLPGVNVVVKGTLRGTITDVSGKYTIDAGNDQTLLYSFVGFTDKEVAIGNQSVINVVLEESARAIDEVVVVGYGVQRKSVVTAAISSVKAEELERSSIGRVEHAIQGRTSGVTVLPHSGSPGAGVKVRVRGTGSNGNSEPLYIVDGMKTGSINDINPNDISSVEILKDAASAAIYGTEGANGVVLITTKSGVKGRTQVNYDFQYGIQTLATKAEMMNASEYKVFMEEAGQVINNTEGYDTDWLKEISEAAPMQRHNLSVTGGNEKSTYLLSSSYLKQDGVIGGSNAAFERYTFRVNTKNDVKSWLEVGNNLNFSHSKRKILPEDDEYRSIVNSALLMDPYTPVLERGITPRIQSIIDAGNTPLQNSKGQYYGLNRFVSGETANPVAFIENTNNEEIVDKLLASFYGTIKPMEGLSLTTRVGMELTFITRNSWSPKFYFSSERSNEVNVVEDWIDKHSNVLWENFATYYKRANDHEFTGMVGMSYEDYRHPNYYLRSQMPKQGSQYAYHDFSVERTTNRVGGNFGENTKVSYFGRASYNLKSRYMIEATMRRDGASVLPENNKWATFPSISGGWTISEEDFWTSETIDFVKFRASWGQNGSIFNVIPFSDKEFWTSANILYPNENEDLIQGSRIEKPTNKDLKWEKSEQTNIGVDVYAFNSKFNFSVDYYTKVTKDLIIDGTPVPSVGYYFVPSVNGGTVENRGWEFETGFWNRTAGGLRYQFNVNLSTLKNEVTSLNSPTPIPGAAVRGYDMTWFEVGKPIWYFRGYKTDGIDPATGEVKVVDVNNDGVISALDITDIGSPHPDLIYGASVNLEYRNFDFSMFLQGMSGNDVFMAWFRTDRELTNKPKFFFTDRWTGPGSNASMPAPDNVSDYVYRSDLMVKDGSYLRVKQIQLGYTIPRNTVSAWGLERARLYVSLDDFFTITGYKGMDPEAGSADNNRQGIDRGLYPLAKKLMFGVSVSF